jgi:hypothetical protein
MSIRVILIIAGVVLALAVARSFTRIRTTGAPWGLSARSGDDIVTLITRLEPYTPTLHRNPANDRYTTGLLIHSARDSSTRRFVTIATGQMANSLGLSRITSTEGGMVRFRAPEEGAYDLRSGSMVATDGFRQLPVEQRKSAQDVLADLATGDDALKLWLTDADTAGEKYRAAFIRGTRMGERLQLAGGGSVLIWETKRYRSGTVMAARVDSPGVVAWEVDTGIGKLLQVLPDPATPAMIGERPMIPGKVSEPILVIIDGATGKLTTHSLWLR